MKYILCVLVVFSMCFGFQLEPGAKYTFATCEVTKTHDNYIRDTSKVIRVFNIVNDSVGFYNEHGSFDHKFPRFIMGDDGFFLDTMELDTAIKTVKVRVEKDTIESGEELVDSLYEFKWIEIYEPDRDSLRQHVLFSNEYGPVYFYQTSYD